MKKIFCFLAVLIFSISMTSCAKENEAPEDEIYVCQSCQICGGCVELQCPEGKNCQSGFVCQGHIDDNGFVMKGAVLLSYEGTDSDVVVPDGIIAIAARAFYNNIDITSITIPDSVFYVGEDAFKDCLNVEYNFFEGQEYIDDVLVSIQNPLEVTTLNLKPTVTAVQGDPFGVCENLTAINVDISNMRYTSKNGILFIKDEKELVRAPREAISGSYSIPQSVKSIAYRAFSDCKGLTEIIFHNDIEIINNAAFDACFQLTSLTIPGNVRNIGEDAFVNCHQLTKVTIGQGTRIIGNRAFFGNGQLVSITVPSSVQQIGTEAFSFCNKNCQLNYDGTKEKWDSIKKPDSSKGASPKINYSDE